MDNFRLRGMGVAMVTPFRTDHSIDIEALKSLTETLIAEGTDFLTVMGTTAETPTLTSAERDLVADTVRNTAAGRIPLVIGIGGNCTRTVCEDLAERDLAGFSAVLSVVPYYNKPTQEGIYRHYEAVASASPLPVIMYNVPGRTGVNMTAETTLRLARVHNIIGVKEASGNFAQIEAIVKDRPDGFEVISGDDGITFPLIPMGISGVISVIGNAYPRLFSRMVHLALDGHIEEARTIHHSLSEIYRLLFADGNPGGIKCLLSLLGRCEEVLRLPLVPVCDNVREQMCQAIHRV